MSWAFGPNLVTGLGPRLDRRLLITLQENCTEIAQQTEELLVQINLFQSNGYRLKQQLLFTLLALVHQTLRFKLVIYTAYAAPQLFN